MAPAFFFEILRLRGIPALPVLLPDSLTEDQRPHKASDRRHRDGFVTHYKTCLQIQSVFAGFSATCTLRHGHCSTSVQSVQVTRSVLLFPSLRHRRMVTVTFPFPSISVSSALESPVIWPSLVYAHELLP